MTGRRIAAVVLMLLARILSMLVGLYYLVWVIPTLQGSFGAKPFGIWTLVLLLPLAGAFVALQRPAVGGGVVLLCALYEAVELIKMAVAPGSTSYDKNVTIVNSILLLLLPAAIAGAFLMLTGWRERQARLS